MSYYWLKKRLQGLKGFCTSNIKLLVLIVQIFVLIVIAFQVYYFSLQTSAMEKQLSAMEKHFKIQQRPIVGVSEIKPVVLGNRDLQSEIEPEDELLINVIFKNIGESAAFINYLKVKIFYGYFIKNKEKPCFCIHALCGEAPKSPLVSIDKEVPTENIVTFADSVLLPNQTTKYTTMADAKKVMENIRNYTSSREAPIFIECEISYSSIDKSQKYWYNCLYEIQWPLAKRITFYSNVRRSNVDVKPIHLTYGGLMYLVAKRQKVKPVIDAIEQGDKDLNKILNCKGVKQQR